MQTNFAITLSAQVALERRLATVAHNIANMNTVGFRAEGESFEAFVSRGADLGVSYTVPQKQYISLESGEITKTDNPLDVAPMGNSWLAINTPKGTAYTHDGRMQLSPTGELQTLTGHQVLDAGLGPIRLDTTAGPPTITRDGMIFQGKTQVGAIGLFALDPKATLSRNDTSSVFSDKPAVPVEDFTKTGLVQGFVEGANINPVLEMAKMMEISRAFEQVTSTNQINDQSIAAHRGTLARLADLVEDYSNQANAITLGGQVIEISPGFCKVAGLSKFVALGDYVTVPGEDNLTLGEILRIDAAHVTVKFFTAPEHLSLGTFVRHFGKLALRPNVNWKGRVINALGQPVDDGGPLQSGLESFNINASPPNAMRRARINTKIMTGIRVIDCFTPICAGQRLGIFAGSGVGKSTILSMMSRATGFDTVVIGLIGERGREVREFLEDALGENKANTVCVVATGDESPMMRRLAPKTATTIAEFFRNRGENVLLILDSVTRFAHAARDVAMAAGEPAVARGYPPSIFSDLPKLLERSGPGEKAGGTITGIYSVLIDADNHNDPIADAIRGTLDGHIVLDRAIADQGRYPAMNILGSISRLAHQVWSPEERELILKLKALISRFEDTRDLRLMGGYQSGLDPELDRAVELVPKIYQVMTQSPHNKPSGDPFRDLADALRGTPNQAARNN
eukprot:gene7292-7363_t